MSFPPSPVPDTPSPPSFTVASPADILAYVPHALGFLPAESLVVLTTAGRRLGATLRVDLPAGDADLLAFAEGVRSFLQGDSGADGVLLIVYTVEAWPQDAPPPCGALVLHLEAVLEAAGMPVRGGWLVSRDVWRDYFCRDRECCPWPGHPIDTVRHSSLNAELIFGGSAFDESAVEAVLRAAPSLAGRRDPTAADPGRIEDAQAHYAACCARSWEAPGQFVATSTVWDAVLGRPGVLEDPGDPALVGFLLASIESRTVRDFLLVSACLGGGAALRGAAACGLLGAAPGPGASAVPVTVPGTVYGTGRAHGGRILPHVRSTDGLALVGRALQAERASGPAAGPAAGPAIGPAAGSAGEPDTTPGTGRAAALLYTDVLAGRHTGAITWSRVDGMTSVLARLIGVSGGESRAAALTMSAWFEYARGRGSRAAVFLDAAEAAVPGYRLARLLHELVRRGGLPAWARSRSTAWTQGAPITPFPPG